MLRRFERRLWALILSLFLIGAGTTMSPPRVQADYVPGETVPPPPDGGAGDPDWPQSPGRQMKSPTPKGGGRAIPVRDTSLTGGMRMWMKWSFRVAYGSIYRLIFRV